MKKGSIVTLGAVFGLCLSLLLPAFAEDLKPVKLPAPNLDQSKLLMQALKERKTTREYADEKLAPQTMANLLWAAFGVNRPDSGRRTAPSAYNHQEIDIYVATADGLYLYDAKANTLLLISSEDIRPLTGTQSFFKDAAVNLVYVADLTKMGEGDEAEKMVLASADTGFIGENVYLCTALPKAWRPFSEPR